MNQLDKVTNLQVKMTSLEVAELLQTQHSNVVRSINRLVDKGIIQPPPSEFSEEINNLGFKVKHSHYVFVGKTGKRDCLILVAQNCPAFTAAIVDRWQELEAAQGPKLPKSFSEALQLAADQARKIEQQEKQIEQDKPAVAFALTVSQSSDEYTIEEAAKMLRTGRNTLFNWLRNNHVFTIKGLPLQRYIDHGYFRVVMTQSQSAEGRIFTHYKPVVKAKGLPWLENKIRNS